MNKKRLLAGILAVLMAVPANSGMVFAAEVNPDAVPVMEESVEMEEVLESEESTEVEVPVEAEESTEVEVPVEAEETAEVEAPVEAEETAEVEEPVETEEPTEVEESVEAVIPEEESAETEEEVEEETPLEEVEEETEAVLASSDGLLVDDEGILRIEDEGELKNEILIPKEAVAMKEGLFVNNSSITSVSFEPGSQMTSISDHAFRDCSELESIDLSNITTIGAEAFSGCTSLENTVLRGEAVAKLVSVGAYAFKGTRITDVSFSKNENEEVVFGKGAFKNCEKLRVITLPNGMTGLADELFAGCSALETLSMKTTDSKITFVGEKAFQGCEVLAKLTIPDSVTGIGKYAFENCKFTTITIPEKVSEIEAYAFKGCSSLTTVTIKNRNEATGVSDIVMPQYVFPTKSLTLKGYDGTVEDYAEDYGYKFKSLAVYDVEVDYYGDYDKSYGTWEVSAKEARAGEMVYVTLIPTEKKWVDGIFVNGSEADVVVDSVEDDQVTFAFVMPEKDVKVTCDFGSVVSKKLGSYSFTGSGNWDSEKKELRFEKAGQTGEIKIKDNEGNVLQPWKFDFVSSKESVAVISDAGTIRAVKAGTATIEAYLKTKHEEDYKCTFKFTVKVGADSEVKTITFSFDNLDKGVEITDDSTGVPVIRYNRNRLLLRSRSFEAKISAKDADGNDLVVKSDWSVVDEEVITLESESSTKNENTITVNKGALGETAVTVKVKNADGETVKAKFIVQVVDATPRLKESSLKVNCLSEQGTKITIVPVYGYDVDMDSLVVQEIKTAGDIKEYYEFEELEITEDGYIRVSDSATDVELAAYTNKLYIGGTCKNDGSEFHIKIPKLEVVKSALNPTIKLTGKINLFFSAEGNPGEVLLTQSLKDEVVDRYELVSAANYKEEDSENPDPFANNFIVTENADGDTVIRRSGNDLMTDSKGKAATSGYLYIYYKGYSEPVKKSIKISTYNTKPSYVLSLTKATASIFAENQEYELQILDKKTKEPIELDTLKRLDFNEFDKGTTPGLFKPLELEDAAENDAVTLKIDGTPFKGKAVFNVQLEEWDVPLSFTFTLNVVTKLPTVKAVSSTLTLNNRLTDVSASTELTCSQPEADLLDNHAFVYGGSNSLAAEAQKITISLEDGVITAKANEMVKKGSYKFKFYPSVEFEGSEAEVPLSKALTITVKVIDTQPEMKLKKSSFVLNALYAGKAEVAETSYTWKNMPSGDDYELNDENLVLTGSNATAEVMKSKISFVVDDGSKTIKVKLNSAAIGKFTYTVNGLKLESGSDEIAVKPFKVTVQGMNKTPIVTVSGKGTLNVVDRTTAIVYTAKISNIISGVQDVSIKEYDKLGSALPSGTLTEAEIEAGIGETQISQHFRVELGEDDKVTLYARDCASLEKGVTYKIKLVYSLDADPDRSILTKDISIKPTQTLPKISAETTSITMYAGERYSERVHRIGIEKTSAKDAVIKRVQKGKASDAVDEAFVVGYDAETEEVIIRLVNPAVLKLNSTYTLPVEVLCKGQMENSAGTTLKININVRK